MAQMQRAMGINPFGGGAGGEAAFPMPGETTTTSAENRDATGNTQNQPASGAPGAQQNPFAALMGGAGGAGGNPFASLMNPALMNPQQRAAPGATQNPSSPPPETTTLGSQNPPQNPFAMLFNPAMMGQGQQGGNTAGSPPPNPFLQNNPFLQDPAAMQSLMQAMGGANGGDANANPMANLMNMFGGGAGGFGAGSPPPPADNRPPEERYATQLRQLNEMGFFDFERNIQALSRSGGDVNGALEWLFSQPS